MDSEPNVWPHTSGERPALAVHGSGYGAGTFCFPAVCGTSFPSAEACFLGTSLSAGITHIVVFLAQDALFVNEELVIQCE